ncbi:unnamed protein product [Withania somnifera]
MCAATCTNETLGQFTDLNDFEYSRMDSDVFMSFLEEPQFEASDEELLRSVIESSETENIAPSVNTNTDDSILLEQMKAEDSTNLSCDVELDSDMDCSPPSDDMNIWFSTDCYSENGIQDLTNFLGAYKEFSWEEPCESMFYV